MRVNIPLANQLVAASEGSTSVGGTPRRANGTRSSDSTHAPSPELSALLGALRDVPELRQETIQEVSKRLSSGELSTPQAADQTVQAILGTTLG